MDYNPLDNFKLGVTAAVILETLLIIGWSFFPEKIRKSYLLIGPVLAAGFIGLDMLFETNPEQLTRITRTLVQAAEEEDADTIVDYISDDFFHGSSMNKPAAAKAIRIFLSGNVIDNNYITRLEISEVSDSDGKVDFTVITTTPTGTGKSRWRLVYTRNDPETDYRVKQIIPRENDFGMDIDPLQNPNFLKRWMNQ